MQELTGLGWIGFSWASLFLVYQMQPIGVQRRGLRGSKSPLHNRGDIHSSILCYKTDSLYTLHTAWDGLFFWYTLERSTCFEFEHTKKQHGLVMQELHTRICSLVIFHAFKCMLFPASNNLVHGVSFPCVWSVCGWLTFPSWVTLTLGRCVMLPVRAE